MSNWYEKEKKCTKEEIVSKGKLLTLLYQLAVIAFGILVIVSYIYPRALPFLIFMGVIELGLEIDLSRTKNYYQNTLKK